MKKLLLCAAIAVFGLSNVNAQDETSAVQTSKGQWLIEANTGFGTELGGNTGFGLSTSDGTTIWNIGFEGGYFVADDLAIKAGLGYGDSDIDEIASIFSYKVGAKYYINSQFPVQVDINGNKFESFPGQLFLGIQAGYAWFINENVSIEPGVRYNTGINDTTRGVDGFTFRFGFALHL